MDSARVWLDMLIQQSNHSPLSFVSTLLRGHMAAWPLTENELYFVEDKDLPFGPEDVRWSMRNRAFAFLSYPFYAGDSDTGATGCYFVAAVCYILAGALGIILAVVRVWFGPPELTSWAAQLAYLALAGAVTLNESLDMLATGYEVAPRGLGTLPLRGSPAARSVDGGDDGDESTSVMLRLREE
jgi:hypothetical protein